ncbi:DNA polymerase IV [Saccharospirillum salsuginis]|uniref:DNA polymerase IV n=1 Tax=Saccharospirillum salsuginis TaxID=418750 RepID=A0A918NIC4_9GAMM|nr:DNA polymerase IV [Saccharospirillum salsuginis]GGX69650.1 DNA polymerase IV [Saccharospirillum salsuginis]
MTVRKIIHIDCDCYYAALEMRDFPQLRDHPVAVGGRGPRGVLSTCNYEARRYGVRSAMPTRRALSLCPSLIIQPSRFDVYRAVSRQIRDIFERYTDRIEPLSLDEAYLDVSESDFAQGSATLLARHLRAEIAREVGITVSAGVAPNKYLAKIASDWNKPDGLCVIPPGRIDEFVHQLPVDRLFGVGQKTAERLHALGYRNCGDLQAASMAELIERFGRFGPRLYQLARGIDDRPVKTERVRKSLSVEHTFDTDLAGLDDCREHLSRLFEELQRRLGKRVQPAIHRVFLKMRFRDFNQTTVERALPLTLDSFNRLAGEAWRRQGEPVRLLGLGVRFVEGDENRQLSLFEPPAQESMSKNLIHQSTVQGVQSVA